MKHTTFEEYMQMKFMDLREIDGSPITKDNYEDLFERWLEGLDVGEIMEYAEKYGDLVYQQAFELKANKEINK